MIGAIKNKSRFIFVGITISLTINFKPSATICKLPQIPTTFGPRRRCTDAITFRSITVKKAITGNINNTDKIKFNNNILSSI
jgi:hypothetical protein